MKILVVHEVSYLSKIIYEFQILPEMLSMLGHDVTVIDYNDSWRQERNGKRFNLRTRVYKDTHRAYPQASVTVRRPGMVHAPVLDRVTGAASSGLEVARVLRHREADVVLLYGLPTVGLQAILAARVYRVPVIFRAIDVTHRLVPAHLMHVTMILERLVFNCVTYNIALTPHLRDYILSYGVSQSKVRLLPSGVDAELFSPGPRNDALLSQWGIQPEDPVVLFMGTIYPFSGLDQVIANYRVVLAANPRARLLIAGGGPDEERLKALAIDKGVAANVIFTGMLPYSVLPDIIRSSDVCINPFELNDVTQKILPTKLFQYMTCEKPVLATPLPGTLTFLAGEQQGVVYSSHVEFNGRIAQLLADRKWAESIGRRGREAAVAYEWKSIAKTMASWLEEAAA